MVSKSIDGVVIELAEGDIVDQPEFDAVVNAANAELMPGGGVAGAIHRAAGPALAEECRPLAPIRPGECVITSAPGLPNRHILHCLGPVYGLDTPEAELLASCYRQALEIADGNGLASVAFPAISTGAFGYPMQPAADIAITTVAETASRLDHVTRVRFVLVGSGAFDAHREALERVDDSAG
ncbi:MAG: macro domain-containing protein [Acidimicrobiales bacterium]|nr:macro domain-containing protein [Acidimicrobiales bacterium]